MFCFSGNRVFNLPWQLRIIGIQWLMQAFPKTSKFLVHCLQIEFFGVELATHPFQDFFVPSIVGVH